MKKEKPAKRNQVLIKEKIAVYTAIFGEKDVLREPPKGIKGCDFICFTDNKELKSENFKIKIVDRGNDPVRTARKYKILSHKFLPEYEYTVWMDGSLSLTTTNITKFLKEELKDVDIAFFPNPERDCIYDELNQCLRLNKDYPKVMKRQIEGYRKENYPKHNGLVATGIILRRNDSKNVKVLNEAWWKEVENKSVRDQLSFNYVAWKKNLKYGVFEGNVFDNHLFCYQPHTKFSFRGDSESLKPLIEEKDNLIDSLRLAVEDKNKWIDHLQEDINLLNLEIKKAKTNKIIRVARKTVKGIKAKVKGSDKLLY